MNYSTLRNSPSRWHWGLVAAVVHRLSGLLIAVFLPFHFLSLGLAFESEAFSDFIAWTSNPLVKISEFFLVAALAVHFAGGLRILALEFLQFSKAQSFFISLSFAVSIVVGLLFLLSVFS
jgi:fumarate reductase subunit D